MEIYDFENAKIEYIEFCRNNNIDIQIFAQPWYLDSVCTIPNEWRVILVHENNEIIGAFPFEYAKSKLGFYSIRNPVLTPRLGVWIKQKRNLSYSEYEQYENKIIATVISRLPYFDIFLVSFDSRFQNWQMFHRSGFKQTTQYSYICEKTNETPSEILSKISKNKRYSIKKLLKEYEIIEISGETYWDFFEKTYKERKRVCTYSKELFINLSNAITNHNAGKIYSIINEKNQIIAANYLFYDNRRSYEMLKSFMPNIENDINSVLTYQGIIDSFKNGLVYDFEGSMIPGVAEYNRKFNARKEQYFVIYKYSRKYTFYKNIIECIGIIKDYLAFWRRNDK